MKFKTPCFIRTKDAGKRKELIAWLENIGYGCSTARTDEVYYGKTEPVFVVANDEDCRIQHNRPMSIHEYDCGTDVELFKALAAMNDENDREQWFTDTADDFDVCSSDCWSDEWQKESFEKYYCYWRKATAEEIIDHFKTIHL